jgi:hypothetical protein
VSLAAIHPFSDGTGHSAPGTGQVLLLDGPTNDLDVNTLRALEEAIEQFAGCAIIVSHDRWFLDRVATHILAFEGDSQVRWFEGNFQDYEADRHRRLGTVTITRPAASAASFWTPGMPQSCTLPARSARQARHLTGSLLVLMPSEPGAPPTLTALDMATGQSSPLWPARPLLIILHGSAELRGCAPPLSDVGLSLRNRSEDLRGRGLATADASGRFRTELQAEAGGLVLVADGDVVELSASGENTAVAAESLWLQHQPDGTLIGGGAPERELALVFGLAGERRVSQMLRTGKQGELRFGIADLPIEADWPLKRAARA